MANELYFAVALTARKGGAIVSHETSGNTTMTGDDMLQGTQVIGTSAELIDFAEITGAPSMVLIQNLDATNFVELGGDSGLTVFKLKLPAGKATLLTLSSATLYAKADTAAVRLQIIAVEA